MPLNLLMIALFLTSSAHASSNLGGVLLSAFGARCPHVVTRHVESSLTYIDTMIATLEKLKDDPDCQGLSSGEGLMHEYRNQYERFLVDQSYQAEKMSKERQLAQYTSWLGDPSINLQHKEFLQLSLFETQTDLISHKSYGERFSYMGGPGVRHQSKFLTGLTPFLQTLGNSPRCFENRPHLIPTLISQALMSAAPMFSPQSSMLGASVGVLVEGIAQFIRDFRYNKAIRDLDALKQSLAFQCVSEAFTTPYCQAEDNRRLIDTAEQDRQRPRNERRLEGLSLLLYHQSELAHWLKEVHAGSAITSEGDLVNREKPILQSELLHKILRYIQTYGMIQKKQLKAIHQPNAKSEAVALAIQKLAKVMEKPTLTPKTGSSWPPSSSGNTVENPIFDFRDKTLLPFQLFNPKISKIPLCGSESIRLPCKNFLTFARDRKIGLNLSHWDQALNTANSIVDETLKIVNLAKARALTVDAYGILVRATRQLPRKTNALQGLKKVLENADRIKTYLTDLYPEHKDVYGPTPEHPHFGQIYHISRTQKTASQVKDLLIEGLRPRTMPPKTLPLECASKKENHFWEDPVHKKSFEITSCISKILKMDQRGPELFFRQIKQMVSYELQARLAEGDFDGEMDDIIAETKEDLVEGLLKSYHREGGEDIGLDAIYQGLHTSQNLLRDSLGEFFSNFRPSIKKALKGLVEKKRPKELSRLCFRLLPALSLPKNKRLKKTIHKYCSGAEIKSIYPRGPRMKWSELTSRGGRVSLEKLFCSYEDYHRDNKIIQLSRKE